MTKINNELAKDIGFCHNYSINFSIPFMFVWNLMKCVRDNFESAEIEVIKSQLLKDKQKCAYFKIQSDNNNFTGKPLNGRSIRNCEDEEIRRVLDCFLFRGKRYYLVGKEK